MIKYYLKQKELNTETKINECIQYYLNKDWEYDEYYTEYEKINKLKPKKEITKFSFSKDKEFKINSIFMKECFLESLKRVVEIKSEIDSRDKSSYLNEEIKKYKEDFNYYPDLIEDEISDKLYYKEELRRHIIPSEIGSIDDKCNSKFFELAPHQLFLKNLLSPNTQYRSILIFHGVGVGKSCSGISIAENFKDVYALKENRIIILASQNIQIGWRKTIYDPKRGDNQCTGDTYVNDIDNIKNDKNINNKAKKTIKKYYELFGYAAFANSVKKLLINKTKNIVDDKERLIEQIKIIKQTYSNRVLIIDEVHNIRSEESQKESRDTIQYIDMVVRYSDNLRLILLTANPMFNLSSEIVWILNLLLINDKRTEISEKDVFDSDGNLKNIELLERASKGYISYLRGENPVSFPIRLYPHHNKEKIVKSPGIEIDIFGNQIENDKKLSFLELYSSKLRDKQYNIYMKEVSKFKGLTKLRIEDETLLLQLGNIVFPNESDDYSDCYGENGINNCFNKKTVGNKIEYSYKDNIVSEYGEFMKKELIGNYSAKIENILEIIDRSDGIVFIYTNWIDSGIIPLVLSLEQNGYKKRDGKNILKSKNKSEYKGNYMVISGSKSLTNNLEKELSIATSDVNKDGSKIKVIIGSTVASEGLDFKNIRSIHILEPWHNINKLEQVIGRGIRNCSHKDLNAKERNVTIYLHTSYIDENETIDMYLYRYCEYKAKQIGNVELILKKNAIDKYFFQESNYISDKDITQFKIEPAYRYDDGNTKNFIYKPSDKKYSRTCSFTDVCDYMKDDIPKNYKINDDTFKIKYSRGLIDVYKKRIHNLFINSVSYTLDEIMDSLSEYKELYEDFLFHALKEMESDKYMLHNNFGDKGYLTISDGLYNFQPYFNNDKLLSPYYRLNRGNLINTKYVIESTEKRKSNIISEKQVYNEEDILKIYRIFYNYKFNENESIILNSLELNDINYVRFSYIFDTLSYNEKLILGYSIMIYLKEGESYEEMEFMDTLVRCMESLLIYNDNDTFIYDNKFQDKNRNKLIGFFLYHNINKKPFFYKYEKREIQLFNKIDQLDINQMITKNKNHKSIQIKGTWGFMIYSDRFKSKNNGMVLKVIKSTDKLREKYTFPPGAGVVIISQSSGAWLGDSTGNFIKEEFPEFLDKIKEKDKFIKDSRGFGKKVNHVFFIELCLRTKNILIQSDLIFMKYY